MLLEAQHGLTVRMAVDVQTVAKRELGELEPGLTFGLAGLAKQLLQVTMNKDNSVRCGNWEASEFSADQVQYAADDAIYSRDVLVALFHQRADKSLQMTAWLSNVLKPAPSAKKSKPIKARPKTSPKVTKGKSAVTSEPTTFAEKMGKRAAVQASFSSARQYYLAADGPVGNLLDGRMQDVVVSCSSHADGMAAGNCVACVPGDSAFDECTDWRADRKHAVGMPDLSRWDELLCDGAVWEWSKGGKKNKQWRPYSKEHTAHLEAQFRVFAPSAMLEHTQRKEAEQYNETECRESPFASIGDLSTVDRYSVSLWSNPLQMKQHNLKSGYLRDVRRRSRGVGVEEVVQLAHWLQLELPSVVSVQAFCFRCTNSAKVCVHADVPQLSYSFWCAAHSVIQMLLVVGDWRPL